MDVSGTLRYRFLESPVEKRDFIDFNLRVVVDPVRDGETQLARSRRLGWSFRLPANVFHAQSCGMTAPLCNDSFPYEGLPS